MVNPPIAIRVQQPRHGRRLVAGGCGLLCRTPFADNLQYPIAEQFCPLRSASQVVSLKTIIRRRALGTESMASMIAVQPLAREEKLVSSAEKT